jgi:ribosomal protein L7/L12
VGTLVVVAVVIVVLAALGAAVAIVRRGRIEGAVATAASGRLAPAQLWAEVDALLGRERKIEAIKLVRERAGLGLREAKDAVDEYQRTGRTPTGAERKADRFDGVDADLATRVRRLKRNGRTIEAVKLIRERTGLGLADAKQMYDAL